jgi:chloramphenicol 3-O-phosphotransferase
MSMPLLVIITGPACTGKTSLGRQLSEATGLPFFYKDGFKEMMYDVIIERNGIEGITLDVTRMLGGMSIRCLNIVMSELLGKRQSLIIEANFDSRLYTPFLAELQEQLPFEVVQVQLKCDGEVLLVRFIERERSDRHPGHQGLTHLESLKPVLLRGAQEPLMVGGELFVYDTTDFSTVDYADLFACVMAKLPLRSS